MIQTVQAALEEHLWTDDAVRELKAIIEAGPSDDKLWTACDIVVAFARLARAHYEDAHQFPDSPPRTASQGEK